MGDLDGNAKVDLVVVAGAAQVFRNTCRAARRAETDRRSRTIPHRSVGRAHSQLREVGYLTWEFDCSPDEMQLRIEGWRTRV